jgi:hypothetical protein
LAGKCDHEDSRLSCIECNARICANCMTQCPVGFRCKACIGSGSGSSSAKKASGTSASPWLVAKTLGICTGIGCAAGWLMPFISVPYVSCIICFFLGLFCGRWLAGILDHRLGAKVGTIVVFGLLIGLSLSPVNLVAFVIVQTIIETFTGNVTNIIGVLNGLVGMIFCPVCFIVGVLRPSIWNQP